MEKILGIDLGTNSIGWAIRDTSEEGNQIVDKGVLTFDKGVAEGKSGEFPMVQKRTESRGKRRNYQAEKYRKWALLECLINNKMCPLSIEELNEWRKYEKGVGRKYPQSEAFVQWLRFDFNGDGKPDFAQFGFDKHESYYIFRVLAISENEAHKNIFKNNPEIVGRIFYQLVQRRGFKGRDEEEAKTMLNGSEKLGVSGRDSIAENIEKYKTLGAALYHLQKEKQTRIRKRYNLRTDYEAELKEICRVQSVSDDIYKHLAQAIVWQRPLRSQKGLVGMCTFENNKNRCPISHPLYEEFRTWVFINNLNIKVPLGQKKPTYLKEKVYPLFYNASTDFKLSTIKKQLNKDNAIIESKFKDETKVISCKLLDSFEKLLGKDWKEKYGWNEALNNQIKSCTFSFEDIWHVLFTFDSTDKLKEFATQKLFLNEEAVEKFVKIKLPQGYATLSLSAIKKILPYLYKGFIYSEAIYLANLPKVFGSTIIDESLIDNFENIYNKVREEHNIEKDLNAVVNDLIRDELNGSNRYRIEDDRELDTQENNLMEQKLIDVFGANTWDEKSEDEKKYAKKYVAGYFKDFLKKPFQGKKDDLFLGVPNLHQRISKNLNETYGIDPARIKKYLWHPSEQESYAAVKPTLLENGGSIKFLGEPQPISRGFKNPMALKTLHKLKNLINYLLETGKIDEDTRVVVEIARELNDANRRKAIERWQREREKENEDYKKIVDDINKECDSTYDREDKTLLDRIRLWKEQNMRCLYTGKTINMCDLFNGSKYDYEHTIPASMSFDNELKNLTIASTKYNREIKQNKIPFSCPNYDNEITINGISYPSILSNIETVFGRMTIEEKVVKKKKIEIIHFKRIEDLEDLHDEWRKKTSDKKDIKDAIIQRRHLVKMELDYWRKKLETFTCKEYKAGWRNSQLRDTQVITKYALPYLKTVFKKTEVQKGSVTDDFRKIYKIQPRLEKKKRDKHSHHAIDAMTLTLIPPAAIRDKILGRYNEANDKNLPYHEDVRQWAGFKGEVIKKWIEENTLINFQPQYRIITDTYKQVRKRGKQQFVKEKQADGKWIYKLDDEGKRIPLIAKGDTIRGQLHKETFFAAIKQPQYKEEDGKFIPQTDGLGNFIFQKNEKRGDEIFIATKVPVSGFEKIEDFDIVIDPNLKKYLKEEVQSRLDSGKAFAQAVQDIYAFGKKKDRNGNSIQPIRHLRCKVKGGGGGFLNNPAIIKPFKAFISKKSYKQSLYAQNGETSVCAFYQAVINEELIREIVPYSILDISKIKEKTSLDDAVEKNLEKKIKKATHFIPLYTTLKINQKVMFYESEMDELQQLSITELGKRLYLIVKFEDGRISFKHHLNSMPEDDLKKEMKKYGLADVGASSFNYTMAIPKLRLSKAAFNFAIEGKHFEIKPDGEIKWLL